MGLFAKAHLFVLPSRADCFGLATVEAMASGLPVVVSDVGGARDIVEPGVTGWLIRPEIEELVQAIDSAAGDRERLQRMGNAGRLRAERLFDGAANDRAVVDLMLELLEPGQSTVKQFGTEAGR